MFVVHVQFFLGKSFIFLHILKTIKSHYYMAISHSSTERKSKHANTFSLFSGVNITNPEVGVPFTGVGGKCPAGYECPNNSTFPSPCLPGTYARMDGMPACETCPDGYYCVNATVDPVICPQGYYCPAGTEFAHQYPCEEGTYNNDTGRSGCIYVCHLCYNFYLFIFIYFYCQLNLCFHAIIFLYFLINLISLL